MEPLSSKEACLAGTQVSLATLTEGQGEGWCPAYSHLVPSLARITHTQEEAWANAWRGWVEQQGPQKGAACGKLSGET